MKKLVVLGALCALLLVGAAIRYLPWWGGVGVVVALAVAGRLVAGRLLQTFILRAFRAKGAVLAGASARVHAVTPAEPAKPDPDAARDLEEGLEEEAPRRWVHVDVTIEPATDGPDTPFRCWDPSELSIVRHDAVSGEFPDDSDEVGTVFGVELHREGAWVTCEEALQGPQRVRLHVAAAPGVDRFKIRYYFEVLRNGGR